ncbi:unnamed protein product [Alopecurus aequalis]
MADRNSAEDPKSSNGPCSDHGAGGSGSTSPPDAGNAARAGSTESDSAENPPQADRYMSIGNGGRGGGKSHDLPSLHGSGGGRGSSGSGYPHGSCNGFTNLQGSGGVGGSGSSSSGYPQGLGNGYGSGHPYGFGNGYANLHWSGGSTVPFSPHYGYPDGSHLGGGGSRGIHQRAPGGYNNSYGGARVLPQQAPMNSSYAARHPQRPGYQEYTFISEQLGSLSIGTCYDVCRGNTVGEFRNQRQRQDPHIAGREQRNIVPANVRGVYAGNYPYWHMSLEDVKGSVRRVAKDVHGCQFLCRMVKERREDAVRCVFDEVVGEIVRLMGNDVGVEFVDVMARLWTDEQFIVGVVMRNPYDVAYNKHGCHIMKRCIDNSIDIQTRDFLVYAVCFEGLGLAQNEFGNYVVQHVIRAVPGVPWAMKKLHDQFQRMYVSLSRQKASSNVVQVCLTFFPQEFSYEIVWELITDPRFPELIEDPFANYVLQSAVSRTTGSLLRLLEDAVRPYRNILRGSMHARKLLRMLFPYKGQQFF